MIVSARLRGLGIQFIKFGMVGVVGLTVDVSVLTAVMAATGASPYVARLVSFMAAATTTWALNRNFTFRGTHEGTLVRQWARFIAANSVGGLINYGTFSLLVATSGLVHAHPVLGVAAGSITGMFFNFTASKTVVFRAKRPPPACHGD